MSLIDFHCHLTHAGGYAALPPQEASLFEPPAAVLSVTNRPEDWRALAGRRERRSVAWGLGLHPELRHADRTIGLFLEAASRCEAVGEVGLDYSASSSDSPAQQRRNLARVLSSEDVRRRLVSLHSRRATQDVLSLLEDHRPPGAILHWFLGAPLDVERAVDLDLYFSVNESMLTGTRGRQVLRDLPPNRVVLETDAPYAGSARNPTRPGHLTRVVDGLGKLWNRTPEDLQRLIESNQRRLLDRVDVVPPVLRTSSR